MIDPEVFREINDDVQVLLDENVFDGEVASAWVVHLKGYDRNVYWSHSRERAEEAAGLLRESLKRMAIRAIGLAGSQLME